MSNAGSSSERSYALLAERHATKYVTTAAPDDHQQQRADQECEQLRRMLKRLWRTSLIVTLPQVAKPAYRSDMHAGRPIFVRNRET